MDSLAELQLEYQEFKKKGGLAKVKISGDLIEDKDFDVCVNEPEFSETDSIGGMDTAMLQKAINQ